MALIVISPYSRHLRNDKKNPKDYPYWPELIQKLLAKGYKVSQIGEEHEEQIEGVQYFENHLSFEGITNLIIRSDLWIAVDNFLQHHINVELPRKKGIVLWGQSDPSLFGYDTNYNLYKDKSYFRLNQFAIWEDAEYIKDAFVSPDEVMEVVRDIFRQEGIK